MSRGDVRTAEEWAAKRAELSERWRGRRSLRSPMTFFEMEAAVMRDSADAGDGMADYDRRGLLNVIAVLLDELALLLADTPSVEPAVLEDTERRVRTIESRLFATLRRTGMTPTDARSVASQVREEIAALLPTQASDSPEKP